MKLRVYYEDTDAGGIVYHANYIKYCERARSEVFFTRGLSPELDSGHFVARKLVADYLKPAKLGDMLEVKTQLLEMRNASFTLKQTITKDDVKLFELVITLAYIDFEGRPQKLSNIKEFILELF